MGRVCGCGCWLGLKQRRIFGKIFGECSADYRIFGRKPNILQITEYLAEKRIFCRLPNIRQITEYSPNILPNIRLCLSPNTATKNYRGNTLPTIPSPLLLTNMLFLEVVRIVQCSGSTKGKNDWPIYLHTDYFLLQCSEVWCSEGEGSTEKKLPELLDYFRVYYTLSQL